MGRPWWPGGPPVWQQGGHPQNEGGPYRKRAAARAALRKRGGPKGGPQGRQAGPGGQSRARGRPTGPPSRPDHSVKCAGSSKTGSGDLFLPIFFGVCVKDALFRPPRGPPPPPQAHQRPRPVKATTYRTPVPKCEKILNKKRLFTKGCERLGTRLGKAEKVEKGWRRGRCRREGDRVCVRTCRYL